MDVRHRISLEGCGVENRSLWNLTSATPCMPTMHRLDPAAIPGILRIEH
jgi:hypothetical protein